jgi:hypothetical protein
MAETDNCTMIASLNVHFALLSCLKGESHEKVGEMRIEGDSLGPN